MNIVIRNYIGASQLLECEPKDWSAIVILDSNCAPTSFVSEYAARYTYLTFDDLTLGHSNKRIVEHTHLQQAMDFATDVERLLVCCRAGQSRSAATAYVVAYARRGRSTAIELLDPKRHIPNELVVRLGSDVLEMPEIFADFKEWQVRNQHVKLADFYDEIEAEVDELERQGARNRITT